ncbi:hypothetical protein ACFSM5_02420 [Lacibacterium aquatile]|uniref:IclR-ED domain-containing protein n=1 Tax=Lacibacterium aquatile TaxID=1168082 RepID=A0ABW5DLW3_9PROT
MSGGIGLLGVPILDEKREQQLIAVGIFGISRAWHPANDLLPRFPGA